MTLPGKAPFEISSPLSFFNGPPAGGKPTLIAHAYETVPAPKTLLVPIAIERIKKGRYGYRVEVEMPKIAEGYGAPTLAEATIGATFASGGQEGRLPQRPLLGRTAAGLQGSPDASPTATASRRP